MLSSKNSKYKVAVLSVKKQLKINNYMWYVVQLNWVLNISLTPNTTVEIGTLYCLMLPRNL